MWKDFEEKRSCKYSPPPWILSRGKQVSSYSWQYMPLPSREQSTVCAWHEFGLTNKSAEWNVVLEGFKQPWTSNTVYACWIAVWSNIQCNSLAVDSSFLGKINLQINLVTSVWQNDFTLVEKFDLLNLWYFAQNWKDFGEKRGFVAWISTDQ